jgi:phospholipase C
MARMKEFFADAKAGKLPSVTYLDPPFAFGDDHPPHHPSYGQALIASVYNALATSPQWEQTLLVVTYDEHGGFYDHVAPPRAADERVADGFDQLGFRVPALVIGPYVKQGHVSSVVRDHTSALKHLEGMFGTEPLTARSTAATDLSELIDLDRLRRGEPAAPITIPTVMVDETNIPSACVNAAPGVVTVPGHPVLEAAAAHPELIARWDARDDAPALWAEIARLARSPVRTE